MGAEDLSPQNHPNFQVHLKKPPYICVAEPYHLSQINQLIQKLIRTYNLHKQQFFDIKSIILTNHKMIDFPEIPNNLTQKQQINEQLIKATRAHDLPKIQSLIQNGADINYMTYKDNASRRYGREVTNAINEALYSSFKEGKQEEYIEVVKYLLENEVNTKFKWKVRGEQYKIFGNLASQIKKLENEELKIKFVTILSKYQMDMNQQKYQRVGETWAIQETHSCFIFSFIDSCGLKSKIGELKQLYESDQIQKLRYEKYVNMNKKFNQEYKMVENMQNTQQQQYFPPSKQEEKSKVPQINFLKTLINLGAKVNSSNGFKYKFNSLLRIHLPVRSKELVACYEKVKSLQQSLIHRAIMNNNIDFVKFLIQKGADINKLYTFTVCQPFFPIDWPESLKKQKIKQNLNRLRQYENEKSSLEEQIKSCNDQNKLNRLKSRLRNLKFSIFKAQRYNIEGDIPIEKYLYITLSCLQLAEIFKVDPEIIQMLKNPKPIEAKKQGISIKVSSENHDLEFLEALGEPFSQS